MTDQSDFTPEDMVLWALDMAKETASSMTQGERIDLLRSVTGALAKHGVIDKIDDTEPGAAFTAASQMLYVCGLSTMIFPATYKAAEDHLDNVEQLKRSFDL